MPINAYTALNIQCSTWDRHLISAAYLLGAYL